MKSLLITVILLIAAPTDGYACGQGRSGKMLKRVTVQLRGEYVPSSFYLRGGRDEVMFFSASEIVQHLRRRIARLDSEALDTAEERSRSLLKAIENELPLSGPADLFRYALLAPGYGTEIELLAAELLLEGKASVTSWFNLHSAEVSWAKSIKMATKGSSESEPLARWFCTMNDAPLLSITYILY
jgi:hypothetical protein